jgi:hypothetical protein
MKLIRYFSRTGYWQIYAFNNPPEGYQSRRAINIPFHKFGMNSQFLRLTKIVFPFQRCDIYHTCNSVVTGENPWGVEVETTVPQYGQLKEGYNGFMVPPPMRTINKK